MWQQDRELGTATMNDRLNTIVCIFEQQSPRISALDIHEWIYDTLRIPEQEVRMIQIEGTRRQVYTKLSTNEYAKEIVKNTEGQVTYKQGNGEISIERIDFARMRTRRIRIADLLPDVTDQIISRALTPYGEVLNKTMKLGRIYIDIRYRMA